MMLRMMTDAIDTAARRLVAARLENRKIDRLPESCRPATHDDALLVQRRIIELLEDKVGGWKCSLPHGDDPFIAPLPASTIRNASPCPIHPQDGKARMEPEIAFVMGRDMEPRKTAYSESEVRHAIGETRLVLELIGSRHANPKAIPFPEHLADSINNQGLFIGPVLGNAFEQQLDTLKITVTDPNSTLITHDGRHPNGQPLLPLVWLVNFLSSRGETLKAGLIVTTGSYAGVLEVPLQTPLTVSYGNLGQLGVTLASW